MLPVIFLVSLLVALAAMVLIVISNPEILGDLGKKLIRTKEVIETQQSAMNFTRDMGSRPNSSSASVDEQFQDLRVGELFKFDSSGMKSVTGFEYQVKGTGRHHAQNREGRTYQDRGDSYPMYEGDDFLMMQRTDGWFFFTKQLRLVGESEKPLAEAGIVFDEKYGQQPGVFKFNWSDPNGTALELTFTDIGYTRFEVGSGTVHIPDGKLVKYVLAQTNDLERPTLYLEIVKDGPKIVWYGYSLGTSLEGYVFDVLRAAA